jgi:hypothetical protein
MKHIKLYEEFFYEFNHSSFSIRDTKEGDIVQVEGRDVIVTKFLSWVKNKEAKCISFEGRLKDGDVPVTVKYNDRKDGYVFSTEVAPDGIQKTVQIYPKSNPHLPR